MNKSDFPIFKNHPQLVYLDNAATSQKPQVVIDAVRNFYETSNANVHRGIYSLSEKATALYENSRQTIASFINAQPEEIIFTSGTTNGINLIAHSIAPLAFLNAEADSILFTEMEHHSNITPWHQVASIYKPRIDYVGLTDGLRLNLKELHTKVKNQNVKVLALTHASNVLGTVNPIAEIVKFMRKNSPHTIIVLDAAQSIAHLSIDVTELDVDFLVFSGHKLFGPTGTGVVYGKKYLLEQIQPVASSGGNTIRTVSKEGITYTETPEKFEGGTPNIAGAIGLATAVNYIKDLGYEAIAQQEKELADYFIKKVQELPNLKIFGPKELKDRLAVFAFQLGSIHAHDVAQILAEENIAVRAGHHCTQILHKEVLQIPASVRASLSFYNTIEDIDQLFNALAKVISIFK